MRFYLEGKLTKRTLWELSHATLDHMATQQILGGFFDSSALIGIQPSVTRKRVGDEALYKPKKRRQSET